MLAFRPGSVINAPVGAALVCLAALGVGASMVATALAEGTSPVLALVSPAVVAVCALAYGLHTAAVIRREGGQLRWRSGLERGEAPTEGARLRRSVRQSGRSSIITLSLEPGDHELLRLSYSKANLRQAERVAEHLGLPFDAD
ncbi:hypothetical protein PPSIR1_14220 [Plesiocystis pacifica SIR-1]|uniref:Uncharacterized protein n=1 Tax=Plesiocystis pacifica SIR-1 TaxID=391625 RepID=A6GJN9_9BACT|nr:hypothetical protein [Plesiocystis pacifica]EDM73924.1 hypothetical protein PPSIR1_14220 [Plesiocystis pacifica SIR-1]